MDRHAASQYYSQPANTNTANRTTEGDGWTPVGRHERSPPAQSGGVTSASPPRTQPMQAPVRGYDVDGKSSSSILPP